MRSAALKPVPVGRMVGSFELKSFSSMMPMHWPWPVRAAGKSYSLATWGGVKLPSAALRGSFLAAVFAAVLDDPFALRAPPEGMLAGAGGIRKRQCGRAAGRLSNPSTATTIGAIPAGTEMPPVRVRSDLPASRASFSFGWKAAVRSLTVPARRMVRLARLVSTTVRLCSWAKSSIAAMSAGSAPRSASNSSRLR